MILIVTEQFKLLRTTELKTQLSGINGIRTHDFFNTQAALCPAEIWSNNSESWSLLVAPSIKCESVQLCKRYEWSLRFSKYRRDHVFESRWSLKIFFGLILSAYRTATIIHNLIVYTVVQT